MAVLARTPEQEEEERQQQMQLGSSGPLAPQPIGGGPQRFQALSAASNGGAARGGSGFVGLDRYAAANQGATEQLGGKVLGQVTGARDLARSAIGQTTDAFNASVGQSEVTNQAGLLGRLSSDPVGLQKDTAAANQLVRQRDANYTGPAQLEETQQYSNIAAALANARQTGELTKTESGIGELADKSVTGNRTTGGRTFDTALLLGNEGIRGQLDQGRQSIEGLGGELTTASTNAQARAQQARETTDATRAATRSSLTEAQTNFDKQIAQALAQKQQEAAARSAAAQDAVRGITFGQGLLPTTGTQGRYYGNNDPTRGTFTDGKIAGNVPEFILDRPSGQNALPQFNADLANFSAAQGAASRGAGQAVSDLGLSQQQLAQLLDLTPVQQFANASAAGTGNVNPYSFVEDYWARLGDPSRFLSQQDPNVALTRANTASADDYARAGALDQLAGPELSQHLLDPSQAGQAGTGSVDLSSYDLAGASNARNLALQALAERTAAHQAGNARNGGDTFIRKLGTVLGDPVGAGLLGADFTHLGLYDTLNKNQTAADVKKDIY